MDLSQFDWKFKIFGFPVRVMISFWLVGLFFSPFSRGFGGPWLIGLLGWSAGVFLSILIHELAHAFAIRYIYGSSPTTDLGIGLTENGTFVFGGFTSCDSFNQATFKGALATAIGPIVQIASSVALTLALAPLGIRFITTTIFGFMPMIMADYDSFSFLSSERAIYFAYFFVESFVRIGILWSLFNLAPIFPCDAGQVLLATFGRAFGIVGFRIVLVWSIVLSAAISCLIFRSGSYFWGIFFFLTACFNVRILTHGRL
ncbi:MAG: hypothetical protein J6X44_01830 [Thermoguttaceae bacterium]|nr:hypothetical protein [Thermoguttaceae bacterium]